MAKAYELPAPGEPFDSELFKLGAPCKRNHIHADGLTLRRRNGGQCIICSRIDSLERQQRLRQDPEYNRKRAAYVAEKRKREGRPSRAKRSEEWHALRRLHAAINRAGKCPSVAQLVQKQQLDYWRDHSADRLAAIREQAKQRARWRHMTETGYRLYHRAKSKARKVAEKGGTPFHLPPSHLIRQWGEFGHRCAYCGASGDLEVEHVIPISKGGEHHLGNIVPACHSCNSSKRSKDAHDWYKAQPFYKESQWQKIQAILNKGKPTAFQIPLLLPSPLAINS
jgi:5-methylcytosine-specific restriction endonuclease McrA